VLLATQVDGAGQPWVVHLTADGTEVSRERGAARLALSTDGTQLAYVVSGGAAKPDELHSSGVSTMGGGEATQAVPAGVHATPIGYASGGVVYQTDGTSPKVYLTNLSDPPVALPGLLAAGGADENNGVVSGQLTSGDPGSCWVVVKADTGRQVWETCDYALGAFSWDGRYVLGTDAYGDGLGSSGVAILDARTGEVVQRFARPAGSTLFVRDLAWEPSGHALDAIVHEGGSWQILRLGVDGSLEAATDPVSGSDTQSPYVFAATR
jgi:hypothetical protein